MAAPLRAPDAPVPAPPRELTREERTFTLAGVLLAMLLAALDQTIVATAGPAIQRDLAIPPGLYAWITTSYLVASTVMVPIYGKLSDRAGRKPILLAGVVVFLLGSLLCGIAPTAILLILARGVQGLGAAALFTTAFAVIADLFPPAVRGRYMGLVSGVMGVASVVGPLVGGFLTDNFGWHWVFFVNLPIGGVALWFIVSRMPRLGGTARGDRPPLDVQGAGWLIVSVVPLLVALSLGRVDAGPGADGLAWGSWPIVTMLAVAAVGAAAFVRAERRAADPIIHLEIFRNRVIGLGTAAVFVLGAGFLFVIVFLPLYLVNVVGISATSAGLTMMPLTLAMVAASIATGQVVARIGRYKKLLLGSLLLLMIGFAVMGFTLTPESTTGEVTLKMILVGLGIGPTLPLFPLIVQNAADPREIGVVTAAVTFSRSLGQVIGVALFGTIFATALGASLAGHMSGAVADLSPSARAAVVAAAPTVELGGGEGSAAVALDTAAVKARIRQSVAAAAATASGAGAHPAARVEISPADEAAALAAVDRMSVAYSRAFTDATTILFRVGVLAVLGGFLLTLLIPELPLRHSHAARTAAPVDAH